MAPNLYPDVSQTFAGVPDSYSGRLYSDRTSATCSPSPSDLSQLDFKMEAEDCYNVPTYHHPQPAAHPHSHPHPQQHNHHAYGWQQHHQQHYGVYYDQPAPAAPQPTPQQPPHPQVHPQAHAHPQAHPYEQPMQQDTYSLPPFPSVSTTALTPRQRRASLPLQRSESTR